MNTNKGFTLIELLVVVLIIGILAAMALPQYFKAVERSRMTEAVTMLGNIAQAQQRKFLQINKFAKDFTALDVAPTGASGASFYTKGNVSSGANGNGFKIELVQADAAYNAGSATASRSLNGGTTGLQYNYELRRYYGGTATSCKALNANAQGLCADFCGVDTVALNATCCNTGDAGECAAPSNVM